jgi:hypothetical protein
MRRRLLRGDLISGEKEFLCLADPKFPRMVEELDAVPSVLSGLEPKSPEQAICR